MLVGSHNSEVPCWDDILDFWFNSLRPVQWFTTSTELDESLRARFSLALKYLASTSHLPPVTAHTLNSIGISNPREVLAAILVTDQFSRNIHRGTPEAFSTDAIALALSEYLIDTEALMAMSKVQIQFAVMPHMHAESISAQQRCVELFERFGIEEGLQSANEHLQIIRAFGRFPHRNRILGRDSTTQEITYLQGGNSFGQ